MCSPYGGLLFLQSSINSECSITVSLKNVVLTPTYYLADPNRAGAWKQTRKTSEGLWADINGVYMVFNIPSSSVLNMTDIQMDNALRFWDSVILANHELRGTKPTRRERVVSDIQPVAGFMRKHIHSQPIVLHLISRYLF